MGRPLRFASGTRQMMIRMPTEQYEALMARTERDGIPMAEQFRRAVTLYLAKVPGPSKRARKAVSLVPRHAQEER